LYGGQNEKLISGEYSPV
jgi:type IV secretory pathway VirD2 relaxase